MENTINIPIEQISWATYLKHRWQTNISKNISNNSETIFKIIYVLVIALLCYMSVFIFYSNPELFDSLGKPPDSVAGMITIMIFGMFCLFSLLFIFCIELPNKLCNNNAPDNDYYLTYKCGGLYNQPYHHAMISLLVVIFVIIISNIFTIIAFKYITRGLLILTIPIISHAIAFLISHIAVNMFACYKYMQIDRQYVTKELTQYV